MQKFKVKMLIALLMTCSLTYAKNQGCDVQRGLSLVSAPNPPVQVINHILSVCDQKMPNNADVIMLHGLLARQEALQTKNFKPAIDWFQKGLALNVGVPLHFQLELAVTYEWAEQPEKAGEIYQSILSREPNNRAALLGQARVYRALYQFKKAEKIYKQLLAVNPNDIDALNGEAMINLANYRVEQAQGTFINVLGMQQNNEEAQTGLDMLKSVRANIFSFNQGQYVVGGETSQTTNINYKVFLDALNQLIVNVNHNSDELQLDSVLEPGVLPKNSLFVGMQHQYPFLYGVGVDVEYRERTQFRDEYRIGVNTNYFIKRYLQWFAGARQGFPSPWNNKLFYSGFNFLTNLPVDVGVSGYWGRQQFGGSTSAYGLDLRKEFSIVSYYDVGASYSPSQTSWEIHSLFVIPVMKHQGLEASYNHYYFNGASVYNLGWRVNF